MNECVIPHEVKRMIFKFFISFNMISIGNTWENWINTKFSFCIRMAFCLSVLNKMPLVLSHFPCLTCLVPSCLTCIVLYVLSCLTCLVPYVLSYLMCLFLYLMRSCIAPYVLLCSSSLICFRCFKPNMAICISRLIAFTPCASCAWAIRVFEKCYF